MEVAKALNLKALTKAHENKWVALSSDYSKVLAVADTLRALWDKVASIKNVAVMRVLPSDVVYAPTART